MGFVRQSQPSFWKNLSCKAFIFIDIWSYISKLLPADRKRLGKRFIAETEKKKVQPGALSAGKPEESDKNK